MRIFNSWLLLLVLVTAPSVLSAPSKSLAQRAKTLSDKTATAKIANVKIASGKTPAAKINAEEATASVNWRIERQALEGELANRLEDIAAWCRDNDIQQQVEQTFSLHRPRDLNRQYIFIPSEDAMPVSPEGVHGQWLTKINEVRNWQAERIFELAKRATQAGAGNSAFQLLNEVLYFNSDHEQVRKILGHTKTDEGWRVAPDRIKVRPGARNHDTLRWPAKSYIVVTTPNFSIESNASEAQTRYLAEKLERWHAVWRQVFFEYWSSASVLQRWIDGKSSYRHSRKKFRVVFFKNRNDYTGGLSNFVPGIEQSTGYYFQRISYFYDDPDRSVEDTWRHELTHQLFRESIKTGRSPFEDHFIWLDEGIATYFESLSDFGDYVTLGGFEARRIQHARVRMFLENFPVSTQEISELGRKDLQQHQEIRRLYSVFAGLTDMLMNGDQGAMEPKLTEFLKIIFAGRKIKAKTFETIMGYSYEELDQNYRNFLRVDGDQVAKFLSLPLTRTEMSLAGAKIDEDGFKALGECHNLNWIDLSNNTITATGIARLANCKQLNQLFFTESRLERGSLKACAIFPKLDELDLSGSSVVDPQLVELAGLQGLTSLRLTATQVSDAGLVALEKLPNLRSLDVSRSKVTDAGIARLKQRLPNLTITK